MKKHMKILALITVFFLALSTWGNQNGINVVVADDPSVTPTPTPTDTSAPTPSETPSPTPAASETPTPAETPSPTPVASETPEPTETPTPLAPTASPTRSPEIIPQETLVEGRSGSTSIHEHSFEYVTIQDATETQDAILQLQCSCGATNGTIASAGSSVHLFVEDTINAILNAPQNGIVVVNTEIWTCYNQKVMDALLQRPDVTLVTNYRFNHVDYTVTIPAGYETNTLVDENGYCGFRHLDQVLGGSEIATK